MSDKVGKVYKGIVSSVTDFGIFVTIPENGCDALLKLSNIKGTWQSDMVNYQIKEHNTQDSIRLGDTINVVITQVDLERKSIDCSIIRL